MPKPKVVIKSPKEPEPGELGIFFNCDATLLMQLGWVKFVKQQQPQSDFAALDVVHHLGRKLLDLYKRRRAPVKMSTEQWSKERINKAL